ncbi:MAG TPA: hypothetical protein ENG87_02300 [Candidatus Pacearchaeota archaeon]|nr:hypothetical protein [Candidatus Pacearchaeota archaeon]HDZ60231.1 hypothetical protein [Candidatus Pacearchaeota archaeon]
MVKKTSNWIFWVASEAAFISFLYYIQYLLKVDGNLLISTFILWMLINISIVLCPVVRKCYK